MNKNVGFVLVGLAIVFSVYTKFSQPKIAFVNSQEVIAKYKGTKEANLRFEKESKSWQGNIQALKTEVDSLNRHWVEHNAKMKKNEKTIFAQKAQKKSEEFQHYNKVIQQKAAQRQQELMNPVRSDLNKYIEEYAEENGYDMVFGTMNGNIVYAAKATDITKEIIKYINEQYN